MILSKVDDLDDYFNQLIGRCGGVSVKERILVVNKSDLLSKAQMEALRFRLNDLDNSCLISCTTEYQVSYFT